MNCLVYLYHGQSLGHVRRTLSLAGALQRHPPIRNLVLISGGELPCDFPDIRDLEVLQLPSLKPLPGTLFSGLTPAKLNLPLARVQRMRRNLLCAFVTDYAPDLVVTEHYPFGRARLRQEVTAMLATARKSSPRCRIVSSMRDILGIAPHKITRAYKASLTRNVSAYFDELWVHGDPTFHRLEPVLSASADAKVRYTGYVDSGQRFESRAPASGRPRVLVSAGGGKDGAALVSLVLDALPLLERHLKLDLTIVVGPYFDKGALERLQARYRDRPGVRFIRFLENFRLELSRSHVSISRCGYNTFLDLVQTGVPAVVIPRGAEPEQETRAGLLARAGGAVLLREADAGPAQLRRAIAAALKLTPASIPIDTTGCQQIAQRVTDLLGR